MPLDFDEDAQDMAERYEDLRNDPNSLLEELRFDIDFLAAVAKADTVPMLRKWFSERQILQDENGWVYNVERTGPIGEFAAGVEWHWTGKHDDGEEPGDDPSLGKPSFNSLPPSGKEVTVHGFTLFGVEPDDRGEQQAMVRRYVDWAGVFAQLGLTLNWRTPV